MLTAGEARQLLDSIMPKDKDGNSLPPRLVDLRDRALIAVMVFSFARISATVSMKVEDYVQAGKRWKFRSMEKGGKYNEVFAHHGAEEFSCNWQQSKLREAPALVSGLALTAPLSQTWACGSRCFERPPGASPKGHNT